MIITVFLFIVGCILFHVRYKMGYAWKDIFSPKRWKAVYIWLIKKQLKFFGESTTYLTKEELLQYSYRVAKCGDCLQAGKCLHCGCDTEGRMNGITDECSAGKWKQMLSKEEMDNFLKDNEFKFNVELIKKESNDRI